MYRYVYRYDKYLAIINISTFSKFVEVRKYLMANQIKTIQLYEPFWFCSFFEINFTFVHSHGRI